MADKYELLTKYLTEQMTDFQSNVPGEGGSPEAIAYTAHGLAKAIIDALPASELHIIGDASCEQLNAMEKNGGELAVVTDNGTLQGSVPLVVNRGWVVYFDGEKFVKVYGGGDSIVIDNALNTVSTNPIANAPVAQAISDLNKRIDEIEPGENVQSDWSEADAESPAYIKNKDLVTQEIESAVSTHNSSSSSHNDIRSAVDGKAPTNHASTATTYGVGDATHYGHVKVDSALSGTSTNPVQNKVVKAALDGKIPFKEYNLSIAGSSTKYLKLTYDTNYHTHLVFFNGSLGVNHEEWLFRSYGNGGTSRTYINNIGSFGLGVGWYVAGVDGNEYYLKVVNPSTGNQGLRFKVCSLDGSTLPNMEASDTLPDGFVILRKGGVARAEKLLNACNLKVNLASTSAQSFDGSANAESIGVGGTLPIAHGGTGATTAANARANLDVYSKSEVSQSITNEATDRQQADSELQAQIDAISSKSDVVDVVASYVELVAYDTSTLGDNDVIKVLEDETHDDAESYYRWNLTTETWGYIGSQGPFVTPAEMQTALGGKAPTSHASTTTTYGEGDATHYGHVKVDSALSSTSTNPVQNKAVYNEFVWKINRVTEATQGNLPAFTANGSLTDSGKKPSDFATLTDIDSEVLTHNSSSSAHSDIRSAVDGKYSKPSGGIPKSDLASDVKTSLGKADTALQQHQSLDGYAKTSVIADHAFGTSKWIDIGYFSLSSTWQSSSIIVNREFYGAQKATQDIISCSRDTSSGDRAVVSRVNIQEGGNQSSYDWKYAIVNGAVHVYVLDSYGTRHSRFEVTPIGSSGTFTVNAVYNADVAGANDIPIGGHVSRADNGSTYYRVLAKYDATQYWNGIRLFDTQVADPTTSTGFALMTMEKLTNLIEVQKKNVVVDYHSTNNGMYLLNGFYKTEDASVASLLIFVSFDYTSVDGTAAPAYRYIWAFEDGRTGVVHAYEYVSELATIDRIPTTLSQLADDSSHRLVTDNQISSWNGKQSALQAQTAYSSKGSSTKVPQITTNNMGQVTGITEVVISQPSVPTASTSTPLMDGAASYGSGTTYARGNHRHPSDTSKANKPNTYTSGHFAALDSNGDLADSGKAPSDFESSNFSKCQENSSGKWYKVATITQKGTNAYCLMCAKIEIIAGDSLWSNNSSHMSNFATYDLMIRRNGSGTNHPSGVSGNTFMIKKNILYGMESIKISAGFVSKFSNGKLSADIWVKGNTDSTSGYVNNILARVIFAGCGSDTTDKGVTVTYYDQTSGESTVPDSIFREATRKVIAATSA